jgi:hypothetical protein
MELVAALVAEHVGFAKGGFRRRSRLLSIKEGLMRKIIALAILAVVAAAFFGLTVPRHVLNTFGLLWRIALMAQVVERSQKATAVIRIDVATRLNVRTRAVCRIFPLSEALVAREHRTTILL